jgi:hypothetical protein
MAQNGLERVVTAVLERMCRTLWGFAPRAIPHVVHQMGPVRALAWSVASLPRYLWTLHVLGPLRTHLACVVISLHNNCRYCASGHAYALELVYLRDRGHLFPVDARTLAGWMDLEPRELASRLHGVLREADLHVEALWVDRTLALAAGTQQPTDAAEVRIAQLVRMLGRMNSIIIDGDTEPDGAQSPINKDAAIKARYAQLRARAG